MDMQDPEEQQLEEQEPAEITEELDDSSGETALSDDLASESTDMPAAEAEESMPAEETVDEVEESAPTEETAADEVEESASAEETLDEVEESAPTEETAAEVEESMPAEETVDEVEESVSAEETAADEVEESASAEETLDEVEESAPTEETAAEVEKSVSAEEIAAGDEEDEDPSYWFVVHCYSGYENKVRHNLEQRIETMGMKNMIFDVVVPTQEEIEVKDGKRRTVERHIFPGYVLVNMILTEESWYVVRNTPGVTGFVGMGNEPTPLRPEEVLQIVKRMEADAPTVKVTFKVGERVRIIDGPFNDFRGVVSEIDMERTKVRVMVNFFGRETPVELDFLQVEKA